MNTLSSQPYKGTRDYYPDDKEIQNYIFSIWNLVSLQYGYGEYSTPLLEPLEVYTAKSGQELATEQTYTFTDRGGRTVAIRPEMTPSISRMVAAKRQELTYPARLFSIANFMRYERPQRGREREFWQLNVDMFGAEGTAAEAEIISMANTLLKKFGASDDMFVIKINNRKLINFVMSQYLGLDNVQSQAMVKLLDRKNKISSDTFYSQAADIFGESKADGGRQQLDLLLNAKSMADLPDEILENSAVQEVKKLFTYLDKLNVKSAVFDITLMRGLDYYTGTVFEVFDTDPENNRSLFGGGRYDGLVGMFGVDPITAVGFAPGYTTTELFIRSHGLYLPPADSARIDAYVISVGDTMSAALVLADQLRQTARIEVDVTNRKIDKQIKSAVKKNAPYIIFVGEDEVKTGIYTVKDTKTGEESKLKSEDFGEFFAAATHNR